MRQIPEQNVPIFRSVTKKKNKPTCTEKTGELFIRVPNPRNGATSDRVLECNGEAGVAGTAVVVLILEGSFHFMT